MLDVTYLLLNEEALTPEEKLARAIVLDWFSTLKSLLLKDKFSEKDEIVWRREIKWPFTENAQFWVEEVLGGSVTALRLLASDIERVRMGENPKYFPLLLEIVERRKQEKEENRKHKTQEKKALGIAS